MTTATKHAPSDLRNVVLLGHGDAGKTTLAEHLLHKAGAVTRLGSVKDKTSVFDFEPDEKERGHSIDCAIAHCGWKGKDINLIDCPGYPDFFGEAITGVSAGDLAICCVNAHTGILVGTRRGWQAAGARSRARAVVVTKTDLEPAKMTQILNDLRAEFGDVCLPYHAPGDLGNWKQAWTDAAVESDDDLMTRYLDGKTITEAELLIGARRSVARGRIVPVVFTSSESGLGIEQLLDMIAELGPSPLDVPRRLVPQAHPDAPPELIKPDPAAPFIAIVFKVQIDKHVGRIVHVRVLTGTMKAGDHFVNLRGGKKEKIGHMFRAMGREQQATESAGPGDLVILTKVDSLRFGDTLAAHHQDTVAITGRYPRPMFGLAIRPKSRNDEVKLAEALHKLAEESVTFVVHREASTAEQVVSGLSPLHVDVMLRRLKDRFGLEVDTSKPKVPYKETISAAADGHHRHKKQSGGRGQFAEVFLHVSPGEAGKGLEFSWDIFGGTIPRNFESAIEKGIREVMARGVVAGYPIEDVKVSIRDGKYHDVDSSDAAFKIAGARGFKDAIAKAHPSILEPIMAMEVTVPSECMGDISGDLNTRRARIRGMDQDGDLQVIQAEIPLAEAQDYPRVLTSLTSGRGTFTLEPERYDQVPPQIQQQILAAYKPHPEEED